MEVTVANTTEHDVVTACFTSDVTIPLIRDALFLLTLSNSTTATVHQDFDSAPSFITVPTNFSGFFEVCINISIMDDSTVEDDEIIEYDVLPLSELDVVEFTGNFSSILFTIIDKDGKV